MPSLETDLLADLIRAKRACLVQLRDAGRRQLGLIEEGDMTGLLDLLAAKQRMLVTLQQIEGGLTRFRGQDPAQRRWRTPQDRQQCAEQLQQCETLLAEIVGQEKCCETALVRRRDEAAQQLRGAHLAGCARGAYTAEHQDQNSQIDLLAEN